MRTSEIHSLATWATLLALRLTPFAEVTPKAPVYQIIVNPKNPDAVVDRQFIEDAFLKKSTTWPDGDPIHPVDLAPGSPVRKKFTEDVLKRSVEAVKYYWQQRIFSGRDVPPPELASDEDVVTYVLKHDGAVGYVSRLAELHGAKPLATR